MKLLTCLAAAVIFCSCGNKTHDAADKQTSAESQGAAAPVVGADNKELPFNSKSIEDITYSVHRLSASDVKAMFSSRFKDQGDYSEFSCFLMDIASKQYPDILDYPSPLFGDRNQKVQYLSFSIKDDLSVQSGGVSYPCLNTSYEPSRGQLPYARFFLVFNKIKDDKATLRFNDNYFNKGIINLSF